MIVSLKQTEDAPDYVWFGRVRVGPKKGVILRDALQVLGEEIEKNADRHWIVARAVLIKLVREALGANAPDNDVISAAINWRSRMGRLSGVIVESESGKMLWTIYHCDRGRWLAEASDIARQLMRENSVVAVRDLEKRLFGDRSYNTWSAASFVLARLVRSGEALYKTRDEFAAPRF